MNRCNHLPIYLAAYADFELKKGLKTAKAEETEDRLNAIMNLFVCLHSRDKFLEQY